MPNVLRHVSIEVYRGPDGVWTSRVRGFGENTETGYGRVVEESWALTLTNTVEQELTAIEDKLKQLLSVE